MLNANSPNRAYAKPLSLLLVLLAGLTLGCFRNEKDPGSDLAYISPLDGAWGSESIFGDGGERIVKRNAYRFVISGSKVRYGFEDEMWEGEIKFLDEKSPKQFDIVIGDELERAIYELDGDQLTICISQEPIPRPTEFEAAEGDQRVLFHLRRIQIGKIGTMVSTTEFQELVDNLENAANASEVETVHSIFDLDGIVENATLGYGLEEDMRLSFIAGLESNSAMLNPNTGLGKRITDPLRGGGNFEFLRSMRTENEKAALFRAVHADGELFYYKFLIGRNCFGEPCIVDLYNFSTAEWLSKSLKQALFPTLASISPIYKDSPNDEQKIAIDSIEDVRRLSTLVFQGDIDNAIETFSSLPESVQSEKTIFVPLLQEAINQYHPELESLIKKGKDLFPADPGLEQLYLEYYLVSGFFKKAHHSLDFLEDEVDNDPYLGTVRGLIFFSEEKYQEAEAQFKRALDAKPELSQPYMLLLMLSLQTQSENESVRLGKILQSKFDWKLEDFEELEGFESFKQSAAFREWNPTK